ncbi:MAG: phosphodiesterase [Coriobacteriales bacterium]
MRIAVASDIHGSAFWCRRLMDRIELLAPDRIVLLGDLLYHGPRNDLPRDYDPRSVAGMLNGVADRVIAVRGNCDSEVDQMMLEFPMMGDYAMVLDATGDAGARTLFCTHGHLWSDGLPPLPRGSVVMSGHTHVKRNETDPSTGLLMLNPGSVSLPKDESNSFALCEDGSFEFVTL